MPLDKLLIMTVPSCQRLTNCKPVKSPAMLKNYIKIASRNLLKNKGFSFINLFGLTIGLACCLLIMLFVQDEQSYDRFHKNAERIYRPV